MKGAFIDGGCQNVVFPSLHECLLSTPVAPSLCDGITGVEMHRGREGATAKERDRRWHECDLWLHFASIFDCLLLPSVRTCLCPFYLHLAPLRTAAPVVLALFRPDKISNSAAASSSGIHFHDRTFRALHTQSSSIVPTAPSHPTCSAFVRPNRI